MSLRNETTEQVLAKAKLSLLISTFMSSHGQRSSVSREIRELVMVAPWLGDLIPDDVYAEVYRVRPVRAAGTVSPYDDTIIELRGGRS